MTRESSFDLSVLCMHVTLWEWIKEISIRERMVCLLLLRIDSVTEMILMLYASLCVYVCPSHFVYLPGSALQIKCTCCLIHRLNRQLLQCPCTHCHMHIRITTYKHTEREMNMEMKTKQVCKYLVFGTGDSLLGTVKSMVNRGWMCSCSLVHVTALQMFASLTVQKMHVNVCFYCVWEFISNVFRGLCAAVLWFLLCNVPKCHSNRIKSWAMLFQWN